MELRGHPDFNQVIPVRVLDVAAVTHLPFGTVKQLLSNHIPFLTGGTELSECNVRVIIEKDVAHVEYHIFQHIFISFSAS